MIRFNSKADNLKLEKGAKRGLLTATITKKQGKIQLLPDRLVKELRRVREVDITYDEMLIWLTQQDINQMNDGLKTLKIKKITAEPDKEEKKKQIEKGRGKIIISDPNGLELIASLLCYNCMSYGHSARDCNAPYCNQCEILHPNHKSNACPNPKNKTTRRRLKTRSLPRKWKDNPKSPVKGPNKKGLKPITSSSYQTDEDDEDSLRQDAKPNWEPDESAVESDEDGSSLEHKRPRRMRTIKYSNEYTYVRKTSQRGNMTRLALHDSGAQAHAARSTKMLNEVIQTYDRKQLKGASREDLNASAIGIIAGLEAPVIVANIEDDIIVSTI